jgi:hypothetical protein
MGRCRASASLFIIYVISYNKDIFINENIINLYLSKNDML